MELVPMTVKAAKAFVKEFHRTHKQPQSAMWAVGVEDFGELVGVAIVGRPSARMLAKDRFTTEVTRVCTRETRNACSILYGACARAAKALGYRRIVTYILESEPGTSLKASGWERSAIVSRGGSWDRPGRHRIDKHPTEPKVRWERAL